jgi:hypothetical protein
MSNRNRIRLAAGATALVAVLTPAGALAATAAPTAAAPAPGGPPPSKAVLKLDRDTARADAKVLDDRAYAADIVTWVKCMNAKGLPTTVTATGVTAGGWTYATPTTRRARFLDSLAGENARDRVEDVCLVRAFGL